MQKWYQVPSVPPQYQGISPFTQKSYTSTGFHLSWGILTRFRTQVTFFIPWQHLRCKPTPTFLQKAQSFIQNLREDYSSHQNLCLLRMHMVWDRLVRAEGCTAVCKLQLEKALGWSVKRQCLMSGH